jgi:hypothetical protein
LSCKDKIATHKPKFNIWFTLFFEIILKQCLSELRTFVDELSFFVSEQKHFVDELSFYVSEQKHFVDELSFYVD